MTLRAAAVRDVVALMTGVLTEPTADVDQALDHILEDVLDDLDRGEHGNTIAVFAGIVSHLLDDLAYATGEPRDDLWQHKAARITATLADKEK